MNKKWEFYETKEEDVKRIKEEFNVPELIARVLANRNITDRKEIEVFLNPTRNDFYDPFLMPDMEKAVKRIIKAINDKEKVIIYGDYDVDGITSITVLKQFLQERGLEVGEHIPNRLAEGYGLNKEAVENIKRKNYTLMITVDCGISGIEEIKICNEYGLETIITDHHEQLEELPEAYAIVNAKRKDSIYPFRGLAGVGVVFKLIQAISIKLELNPKEYLKFLDLVCIGTISDIVPLIDENRVIAKLGLQLISMTKNMGLKKLILDSGYKNINSNMVSFGVAPRINACGRMGYQEEALKLFLTNNEEEADMITEKIRNFNQQRQEIERNIYEQAIKKIEKEDISKMSVLVIAGENWHHGVIGIVASKITEKFFKPTILISFNGEEGKGSGRSIPGFDLHEALVATGEHLEKYGGHEMAVGLTLNKKNIENFRSSINQIAKEKEINKINPVIKIDAQITKNDIRVDTIEKFKLLEPFGEKNRMPVFIYKNLRIDAIRSLSDGKHIKLTLRDDNSQINAIGFNLGHLTKEFLIGDKIDLVGTLELNSFHGIESVQINIKDMMKSIK